MDVLSGRFQVIYFHHVLTVPGCPVLYNIGQLASAYCMSVTQRLKVICIDKARFENKTNSSHLDQPDWVYPVQQKTVASSRYLVKQATILSLRCSQVFFTQMLRTSRTCIQVNMSQQPAVDLTAKNVLNTFFKYLKCLASI